MSNTKRKTLEGNCTHCGGVIAYPAEMIGTLSQCPYCGKQTELLLAEPKIESGLPVKAIVWTVIAIIILGGGLLGAVLALKRAQNWAKSQQRDASSAKASPTSPASAPGVQLNGFALSPARLVKDSSSGRVHVAGWATNQMTRARSKVRLEFELLDAAGRKVGFAMDTTPEVPPGSSWEYRAPVLIANVAQAQVSSISENP